MDYITSNGHTRTTSHTLATHGPHHTYPPHMDHITHISYTWTYRLPKDPSSIPLLETNI